MPIIDMAKNLGSSAKGMLTDGAGEKAVIFIPNPLLYMPGESGRVKEVTLESGDKKDAALDEINKEARKFENDLVKRVNGSSAERIGAAWDDFTEAADQKLSLGATAAKAAKSAVGSLAPGNQKATKVGETASENSNFFKITVQFNPATIRMDSLNGKVKSMNQAGNDAAKLLNEQDYTGRTKLTFDLIFDDVDLMDAFMLQEVVDMNVTKGLTKAYDMYTHAGNTFSVQYRMEMFMALLVSYATQHVIFHWGKMVFRGQVTGVTNRYTMFNTRGNPIRGTMHVEITQDANKNDAFSYDNKAWESSFKKTFKDGGQGGGKGIASKMFNNNILNF